MDHQLFNNYNLFHTSQYFSSYILCIFNDNKEKVLYLSSPKLIDSFTSNVTKLNDSMFDLKTSFVDSRENHNIYGTNKFEKKGKNNVQIEDILDIKKKKNKSQKKKHKQINLENEDLFIDTRENNLNNLDVSIIKTPKINKNKKKEKFKQNQNVLSDDINQLSTSIKSDSKTILINSPLTIQELSYKLRIPEAEIITYLFLKGIAVTINQVIDVEIATEVALKYHFTVLNDDELITDDDVYDRNKINEDLENGYITRKPIITILGHVDHGKTTLLDTIFNTNLVKQEVGGITQSIASREIEWLNDNNSYKLVFLDTPGHEAFTSMRLRGTQVTDLVLLVVAADDGLKPQSIEAIKYILTQKLPYIVVINKIDKLNVNTLKVREELAEYNIVDEKWGGEAIIVEVSALKKQNIDLLLSNICLLSDMQNLTANPMQLAKGMILEAHVDQKKGSIASLVVRDGTLRVGDHIIAGNSIGKVKTIFDSYNNIQDEALPSSIIHVLGFSSLPEAGVSFKVVNDKKILKYHRSNSTNTIPSLEKSLNGLNNRVTLSSLKNNYDLKQLNLILKTNTQGSAEAILHSFSQIPQEKVQINIIAFSPGNISNADVELATASNSLVIGFNINISNQASNLAKQLNIKLNNFSIIYDLIDYVTECMLDLVEVEYDKIMLGKAIVQTVFYINKGAVAGCLVNEGKLQKNAHLTVYRDKEVLYTGILDSLKHLKDDVDEVNNGDECGVMSNNYSLWKKNDLIEAYSLKAKDKVL